MHLTVTTKLFSKLVSNTHPFGDSLEKDARTLHIVLLMTDYYSDVVKMDSMIIMGKKWALLEESLCRLPYTLSPPISGHTKNTIPLMTKCTNICTVSLPKEAH